MFSHHDNKHAGKSFKKLAQLQKQCVGSSPMEVAMELFNFFQEYSQQVSKTHNRYKADLRGLFRQFNAAKNPLLRCFQVMCMVCRLN